MCGLGVSFHRLRSALPADQANKAGLAYVLRILTVGDVEVQRATQAFTSGGRTFAAGTYVIPMKQPYASFAQTMLEVQKYPDLQRSDSTPHWIRVA